MKKAVVTGGTGFIGNRLIQELVENGYEVAAVVRHRERLRREIRRQCAVVESELSVMDAGDFPHRGYDVFFHLAWAGVLAEEKNEVELQLENITMSVHALEVARQIGCRLFIAAGTVAEYAFCDGIIGTDARQAPNDLYGAAKVSVRCFCEVRARQLALPFIWTVLPSTFGEGRTGANIITYTIRALLNGEEPKYGNLEQLWDFLYVAEVARAIRLVSERGTAGKVYAIGSGIYKPLRDYIERIRDLVNPKLKLGIGELPAMSRQAVSSCVDTYDLIRDTGFMPEIGFDEGIGRTIAYYAGLDSGMPAGPGADCPKTNFQKLKVGENVNIMDNDKSQSPNTVESGKKNKTEVENDDRSDGHSGGGYKRQFNYVKAINPLCASGNGRCAA